MSPRVLLLAIMAALGAAADQPDAWRPHDHPATVVVRVVGFTRPAAVMTVAAEVTAQVAAIAVAEGGRVPGEAGSSAVVVVLDDGMAAIAVDEAQARIASAALATTAARTRLAIAERDHAFRVAEYGRIASLASNGTISARERDAVAHAADDAALRRDAEAAALACAGAAERETEVAARAAALRAKHRVVAPGGWIVTRRLIEPGSMAVAGQPLLALADVTLLALDLPLGEVELATLRSLAEPSVRFTASGARAVAARLRRVAIEADPVSRKRLVTLEIAGDAAPEAAGGIEAALELELADPAGGVLVPISHVGSVYERDLVLTAEGVRIAVTVLRRSADHVVLPAASLPAAVTLIAWRDEVPCAR